MRERIKQGIKGIFKLCGFEISKIQTHKNEVNKYALGYVDAAQTIAAAEQSGLSVGDYLETAWNQKDNRKVVVDRLNQLGIFNSKIENICEIGTGAGLYTEGTRELCPDASYESYEPNQVWSDWLVEKYGLISHYTDGRSLNLTKTSSIDLVLAHGVFVYLPFLLTYRYLLEVVRVARDGAYVAFDVVTEDCFDEETVAAWLLSDRYEPTFMSEDYVVEFFTRYNFSQIGCCYNDRYGPGKSKYLVFHKQSSAN
jgi:hypothetical protein